MKAKLLALLALTVLSAPAFATSQAPLPWAQGGTNITTAGATINVDAFGAKGDGSTDDKTAFQAAATSLGSYGGVVQLSCAKRYYLSNLTVPAGVTFRQCLQRPDNLAGNNSTSGYSTMGAVLLSSSGTISLGYNSGLANMAIFPSGMSFPQSSSSSFAGTAITFTADEPYLNNMLVVGFNTLVAESGTAIGRYNIEGFYGDGNNGILITLPSYDSSVIRDLHLWPFASQPYVTWAALSRSGYGLELSTIQADLRLDNALAFGYLKNFYLNNTGGISAGKIWSDGIVGPSSANAVSITNGTKALTGSGTTWSTAGTGQLYTGSFVYLSGGQYTVSSVNSDTSITLTSNYTGSTLSSAPYTSAYANSIGIDIEGSSSEFSIDQLWLWGSNTGALFNGGTGSTIKIGEVYANGNAADAIDIYSGSIVMPNVDIEATGGWAINAASASPTTSYVYARGTTASVNEQLYNGLVSVPSGAISNNLDIALTSNAAAGVTLFASNAVGYQTVASSSTVALPPFGSNYTITGTITVNTISGGWGGRRIVLNFSGVLTVSNSGNVNLSSSYTSSAGSYLELIYDSGTSKWVPLGTASGGSGNVSASGSPTANQIGVWASGTLLAGQTLPSCSASSSALTWNNSSNVFGCNTISGSGTINSSTASYVPYYTGSTTISGNFTFSFNPSDTGGAYTGTFATLSLGHTGTAYGEINFGGPSGVITQFAPNQSTPSNVVIQLPTTTGTLVGSGDSGTVTKAMLAATVYSAPNAFGNGTPNTGAFTTLSASSTVTFSGISGSTQCLHANSSGVVTGTGSDCGSGSGSGTVNAPTSSANVAYYASSSAAVSGVNAFSFNPSSSTGPYTGTFATLSLGTTSPLSYGQINFGGPSTTITELAPNQSTSGGVIALQLPTHTGTLVGSGDTGTISNTMLSNASTTVNSQTCTLGSSCTIAVAAATDTQSCGGGTYTLTSADSGKTVNISGSGACAVAVVSSASACFKADVVQTGAGTVTITGANSRVGSTIQLSTQYSGATVYNCLSSTSDYTSWLVVGDIVP